MTEEEIAEMMEMPFSTLVEKCRDDRDILRLIIGLAINKGIQKGRFETNLSYNQMLREGFSAN